MSDFGAAPPAPGAPPVFTGVSYRGLNGPLSDGWQLAAASGTTTRDPRLATENFSAPSLLAFLHRSSVEVAAHPGAPVELEVVLRPGSKWQYLTSFTTELGTQAHILFEFGADPAPASWGTSPDAAVSRVAHDIHTVLALGPIHVPYPGKFCGSWPAATATAPTGTVRLAGPGAPHQPPARRGQRPGAQASKAGLLGYARRRPRLAAAVAGVLAVTLAAGCVGLSRILGSGARDDASAGEFSDVLVEVAKDKAFTFKTGFDPNDFTVGGKAAGLDDVVQVFLDPELKTNAPDAFVEAEGHTISVTPWSEPQAGFLDDGSTVALNTGGQWGLSDRYYIAEYVDLGSGEPLPKPRVTMFTVASTVPATAVAFEADGHGVGHFTWAPVPGATHYYFVSLEVRRPDDGAPWTMLSVVGDTTETQWSTVEQDEWVQDGLDSAGTLFGGVTTMNLEFAAYNQSEDDRLTDADLGAEAQRDLSFGVIAVTDGAASPIATIGSQIFAQLPVSQASNAIQADLDAGGGGDLETQRPVTMADGSTRVLPVLYDLNDVAFFESGDNGRDVYQAPYTVLGSLFTGVGLLWAGDLTEAQGAVQAANEASRAAAPKTGQDSMLLFATATPVTDAAISTEAPEVPYPVNGSNPLTVYLAANLIAGQERIDVSSYLPSYSIITSQGVDLWDALREAIEQNPYALGHTAVSYDSGNQVVDVEYVDYPDLAVRAADQAQLAAEVDKVVASIIPAGADAETKARAINTYLTSTAEYDYEALAAKNEGRKAEYPRAWTAQGVLIDKRGVCASYAHAFQALAEGAGLESVYVTGPVTDGQRHAWNKVQVGDSWRMVDATWNDTDDPEKYLLLTDTQSQETRTEDDVWMVDSRMADYAAR